MAAHGNRVASEIVPSLRSEIYQRALYVEPQGDFIEMVLIRMDAIEEAVAAWDKTARQRTKRQKVGEKSRLE